LKVSANVKIAVQCFEISGGQMPQMPPWLRACLGLHKIPSRATCGTRVACLRPLTWAMLNKQTYYDAHIT